MQKTKPKRMGFKPQTVKRITGILQVMKTSGLRDHRGILDMKVGYPVVNAIMSLNSVVERNGKIFFTGDPAATAKMVAKMQYDKQRGFMIKRLRKNASKTGKVARKRPDHAYEHKTAISLAKKFIDLGDLETANKIMSLIKNR